MAMNTRDPIIKEVTKNKDPEGTVVNLRSSGNFIKEGLLFVPGRVSLALDNPTEQKESTEKKPKFKKVEVEGDTTGWTELSKETFTDYSEQITEVTESPDKNHRQVTLKNGKKCLLHEQTDKFKKTLPPIEKLLTDLLHLTTDQFTDENGNLIKGKWIEFNEEQKDIVKQLFKSQVVEKAGYCNSYGEFFDQG